MTEFSVKKIKGNYVVMCRNHAKSDVCRGVSAIIYALAQTLTVEHEKGLDEELSINLVSGEAYISVFPKRKHEERTKLILRTCALGLVTIAQAHPDELRVSADCVIGDCFSVGEKS